jgi:hypothetical protein
MLKITPFLVKNVKSFTARNLSSTNPLGSGILLENYRPTWPDLDFNHPSVKAPSVLPKSVPNKNIEFEIKATYKRDQYDQYPHMNMNPADLKVKMQVSIG